MKVTWAHFALVILLIPVSMFAIFSLMWVSAENKVENASKATAAMKIELTQQLTHLPVFPGAAVIGYNIPGLNFILFDTNMYTAVATMFYKVDSSVSTNDVLAFYDQELLKSGWSSGQGYYISKGRYLSISSKCASDIVTDIVYEPDRSCKHINGGYQKIKLLLACDASRSKGCR